MSFQHSIAQLRGADSLNRGEVGRDGDSEHKSGVHGAHVSRTKVERREERDGQRGQGEGGLSRDDFANMFLAYANLKHDKKVRILDAAAPRADDYRQELTGDETYRARANDVVQAERFLPSRVGYGAESARPVFKESTPDQVRQQMLSWSLRRQGRQTHGA